VRNFTDVDDKIIRRAAEAGVSCSALTERFIGEFHADVAALRCLPPTLEPRATAHVPDIVALIQRIIANGHAYALPNGDVYFEVATLPGYGRLSGRDGNDNRAGERVAVDARKRGAADFALWKSAKPGEPSWPSPWGAGRPGWHIECSAMIEALLGPVIDIHGGGADLVFPHHENELAQSAVRSNTTCTCAPKPSLLRAHSLPLCSPTHRLPAVAGTTTRRPAGRRRSCRRSRGSGCTTGL
jgi:cysteinyl-tRNA synthetase